MKILVLDCNVKYISPNRNSLSTLFASLGDVTFFGPGFVSSNELDLGLENFRKKNGPFDVTILTEHSSGPFSKVYIPNNRFKFLKSSFFFSFSLSDYECFYECLGKDLKGDNSIIVQTLTQMDPWACTLDRIKWWEENSDLIWATGKQFVKTISRRAEANYSEDQLNNFKNYAAFVNCNSHKILPYLHYIHDTEINFNLSFQRSKDIAVPGTSYADRLGILRKAENLGLKISSNRTPLYKLLRVYSYFLHSNAFSRPVVFNWYNHSYLNSIGKAKMAYTSGTDFDIFVRKFIEIPSQSTVMMCRPPEGMLYAGFRDGYEYININNLNEFSNIKSVLLDIDYLENMARNALTLVCKSHSAPIRGLQLKRAITQLMLGKFVGAKWDSGKIVFI